MLLKASLPINRGATGELCLACGLCCNGVIFADVKLRGGDDAARLQALGLALSPPVGGFGRQSNPGSTRQRNHRFMQPCFAYDGCRCGIYAERPVYCREFECLLLKKLAAGKVTMAAAQRAIHSAKKLADEAKRLLRELGDTEEDLALAKRFRRMSRRFEDSRTDRATAEIYGRLTLAVHELNLLLHEDFYPPPG